MKTKILILLAAALANHALAQGTFRNLNFEETTLPYSTNPMGFASAAEAFPAWTVYFGPVPQTQVVYNGLTVTPNLWLWSRGFAPVPPLPASFGLFSAVPSSIDSVSISLAQVGTIPDGVNSLSFETFGYFNANSVQMDFGGNLLPLELLSGPSTFFRTWRADLGALAGQTGELRITAIYQPDVPGTFRLDNLQFTNVPEPSTWVLFLAGTALLLWAKRRRV